MKRRRPPVRTRGQGLPAVALAFAIGGASGFALHKTMSTRDVPERSAAREAGATETSGEFDNEDARPVHDVVPPPPAPPYSIAVPTIGIDPVAELRRHRLRLPLDDAEVDDMKGAFAQSRDRGRRPHEAADLMAPQNTKVRAVEAGTIARLFTSKTGGITIYQFDPSGRFCYYYAHLDRYAASLREGEAVKAGDVIGYVGSTGNASPTAPHLHFAIFELTTERRWWQGKAIDPYLVYKPES